MLKSLLALEISPFFCIKSNVSIVARKPDPIIHEVKDSLRALLSIDDVISGFTGVIDGLVQKNWWTWVIPKDCIEEELFITLRPNTSSLVGRVEVELFVLLKV